MKWFTLLFINKVADLKSQIKVVIKLVALQDVHIFYAFRIAWLV